MSHNRRTVFGRIRRQKKAHETAASRSRNRLGHIERLEDRLLLAADFNPWHNYAFPLDINGDYRVTPLDALQAINALKDGPVVLGGALVAGAEAEAGPSASSDFAPQHKFDVNNDRVLSALDVLNIVNALNGEGEDLVKWVRTQGLLTENVPANGVTPVERPIVTTANVGQTILLGVYNQDIRSNDGIYWDPTSDEFGVFSAYYSVAWNPDAFQVPPGEGDNPVKQPPFDWPVSFLNPEHRQRFLSPTITTEEYNYQNGPAGSIDRDAGLISEAGGFTNRQTPYGTQFPQVPENLHHVFLNLHVFDVPFTVQSLYAKDDQLLVDAGSSLQFGVSQLLVNDGLIEGNYQFNLGDVDVTGREVVTWGHDGTPPGTPPIPKGQVVPVERIQFENPWVNVPKAGRELTFVGNTEPSKGTLTFGANGTFNYTPLSSVAGPTTDTFSYTVSDNQGRSKTATVTITIQPVNAPPVITAPANVTMNERKAADPDPAFAFTGGNSVSVVDTDGDPMRVTLATNAPITVASGSGATFTDADGSDGTLAFSGTQTQINNALAGLTYTPAAHFYGTSTLRITTQDLDNGTALSTVHRTLTITVQPVNDPPTVDVPANQTVIDAALPLVIKGIEVGDELDARHAPGGDVTGRLTLATTGGTLTVQNPSGLNITGNGNATVVITGLTAAINGALDLGVSFTGPIGTHAVTATMNDLGNVGPGPALESQATFQVTVVPPTRPFAVNDTFPVLEDSASNVLQVLLNDYNFANQVGGANLEITAVSTPTNGDAVISGNATTVNYTPAPNFFGTDTFTYTIEDTTNQGDGSSTATVTVNVALVNDQPSFGVEEELLEVNEDAGPQTLPGWATFDAGSPQENVVQSVKEYRVEVLTKSDLFSQTPSVDNNGTLTFTPADDAFGSSTFRVQVQDDGGTVNNGIDTSDWQQFTITIHPVNDPPTFSASDPPAVNEDSGPQVVEPWATNFVPGPPNESTQALLGYEVIAVGNRDLFAVEPSVDLNGTLTYTPADDAFGESTFTVVARDSGGTDREGDDDTSAPQTFLISILPVNDPPSFEVAQTAITVQEDAGLQRIEDWVTEFSPGPPNESDQQVLGYIISSISDLGLFAVTPSVSVDGTLTFQSAPDAWGSSTFLVVVQDNGGTERDGINQSQPQEITITVTAVNDAPVNLLDGSDDFNRMLSTRDDVDLPLNGRLTVADVDNDDSPTYTIDLSVSRGSLLLGPTDTPTATKELNGTLAAVNQAMATLIFRPETGVYVAELTIASNDGGTSGEGPVGGLTTTDVLSISVARINQAPIAQDDRIATAEGSAITFNVFQNNGNGPDSAGPNEDQFQQIRVIAVSTAGTLGTVQLLNAQTGEFRYTPPDNDFNGQTTFTYTIQDNGQSFIDGQMVDDFKTDMATVTVTVWEVNDPPVAEDDLVLIDPQPAVGQQFRFHVSELLNNDRPGPANESTQTLTIISVATSDKGASVVLDGDEVVYTVPAGFDHIDTFEYTVQDNGTTRGEPDPKTDTATVTVRDVVLSSVAGFVYIDTDKDSQKNGIDPGIAGVTIRLTGTDITGKQFVRETVTDGNGRYEFSEVMPGQEGTTYTISQPYQPKGMTDGQASGGNGDTTVINANRIQVRVPLIGFGTDPSNSSSDNNNFGEVGLSSDFAGVNPYRNVLYSDIIGDNPIMESGWVFSTDAAGNLQWFVNVGGWENYVPGKSVDGNPHHFRVQIVNGALWVTNVHEGVERRLTVSLSSGRLRQVASNGHTVTHIVGGADYFGLTCYDPPETNGSSGGNNWDGGLFGGGEGESEAYTQAVDALFAAFA